MSADHPHGCREHASLSRRHLLAGTTSLALWGLLPKTAIAGTRDPRFLCIVLRGALDGLSLAAPVGDPDYARLRGKLAIPKEGAGAGLPLTKKGPKGAKVLEDSQLAEVFGIELADAAVPMSRGKAPVARKKPVAPVQKKAGPKAAAKASARGKSTRIRKGRAR